MNYWTHRSEAAMTELLLGHWSEIAAFFFGASFGLLLCMAVYRLCGR